MKTAKEYPVYFPYGATSAPYSKARPHKGNDRCNKPGVPIVIAGVVIGLTGATGETYDSQGRKGTSEAAHLHTQAGSDEWCQQTINPTPYEFQPGVVRHVGEAPQWGKYIIMKVGKVYICYAHLSKVNVKVGQVISLKTKEKPMCTLHMLNLLFDYRFGEAPDQKAIDTFVGKKTPDEVDAHIVGTKRYKDHVKALAAAKKLLNSHLPNEVK